MVKVVYAIQEIKELTHEASQHRELQYRVHHGSSISLARIPCWSLTTTRWS